MGDGTYFHSGLLAIRAAVAAKMNITYKLLFNDAVAMTGGQPVDGTLTVPQLTRQLAAEDVARIIVMSDEPEKYKGVADFAPGVEIRHRDELDATQRELRETPGRHRPDLRPDLRRRKAPPPQARQLPRPRRARLHQRPRSAKAAATAP
jgi:TPP-dependent indolepyruvate ferredoxin oxidoreductase alpha subunit